MLKSISYIIAALLLTAALHYSGLLGTINLTHPIWRGNATLYGSMAGVAVSVLLFRIIAVKPRFGRALGWSGVALSVIALAATLISAETFISAAEFDQTAVQIWHKGSYTVFATFIPSIAFLLKKLVGLSQR